MPVATPVRMGLCILVLEIFDVPPKLLFDEDLANAPAAALVGLNVDAPNWEAAEVTPAIMGGLLDP